MNYLYRANYGSVLRGLGLTAALLLLVFHAGGSRIAAQCGPNPIVCENNLNGNPQSDWKRDVLAELVRRAVAAVGA